MNTGTQGMQGEAAKPRQEGNTARSRETQGRRWDVNMVQ